MRTIYRDVIGGYIFSKDGKLLLGQNRKGGVYEGEYVIPGGGIEEGESKEDALKRELLEETGIDITDAKIIPFDNSSAENEKTLRDTDERVLVKMNFHDFRVDLNLNAAEVVIKAKDDWYKPRWFNLNELKGANVCEPTLKTLIEKGIV
jgi:8-oxo-dGTP pyrophosphatase MutT (NUDIX family)